MRREDWKNGPFLRKNSSRAPLQDLQKQRKTELDFFMIWHTFWRCLWCVVFNFLYSPVKFFTGNLAVVCDVPLYVLFEFTFILCTFDRCMRSFVSEKSPVTRNAFFCALKSVKNVFRCRSKWYPSDPTHPIRRVLPAQKNKVPTKNFDQKHMQHMRGRREKVITKLLFERRHSLWAAFCLLKWVCEISWTILKGRASSFWTCSSVRAKQKNCVHACDITVSMHM